MNVRVVTCLASLALATAGALSCGGGTVATSVYLQVENGAGAPAPDQVRIEVFGATGDGGGALASTMKPVASGGASRLLGTLVIYPGAMAMPLHVVVAGLAAGAVVSTGEGDVTPQSGRQVALTVTLAGDAGDAGASDGDGRGDGGDDAANDGAAGEAGPGRNGASCTAAASCQSGHCVDGVCCRDACPGLCQACNVSGALGVCTPIAAGQDPDNECADEGAPSCGLDGKCDGAGACRRYVAGTACVASTCASPTVEMTAATCDGKGVCNPPAMPTHDCTPYVCSGGKCLTSCSMLTDCILPNICRGRRCQ